MVLESIGMEQQRLPIEHHLHRLHRGAVHSLVNRHLGDDGALYLLGALPLVKLLLGFQVVEGDPEFFRSAGLAGEQRGLKRTLKRAWSVHSLLKMGPRDGWGSSVPPGPHSG